jgi:hypothetical protein
MGHVSEYGVTLDTPEEMDWFRFLTGYRGLHLEAKTGMKLTRGFSPIKFFGDMGFKSKRLKPLLEEVKQYVMDQSELGRVPSAVFEAMKIRTGV